LFGELEHPKIKTRLKDEKLASVMGEYVFFEVIGTSSKFVGGIKDDKVKLRGLHVSYTQCLEINVVYYEFKRA
jgi:hypothetical protein